MSKTGYGLTFSGAAIGSIASTLIKRITVGAPALRTERIRTVGDTYRAGTAVPLDFTDGKMTLVYDWNKTVHNTLRAACRDRTKDTLTFTDSEGSTWVGAGYVETPGEVPDDTQTPTECTAVFEPETVWVLTPAA
jgi:hypothetical protein